MDDTVEIYPGSCLCGQVRYKVTSPLGRMGHCHCTDCRKAHGAPFATFIGSARNRFGFVQGEGKLRRYRSDSGSVRTFCSNCGSLMTWEREDDLESIEIAAATLDVTPRDLKPEYHIFVRSRVSWFEIADGQPQYETDTESRKTD